jgi:putative DNA primase/helicase
MAELTPTELILSKLKGITHKRDGVWALCPSHADKNPSLKIWESDDGACCLKCFAGCETDAILRAIGLEKKHLFPEKPRETDPKKRTGKKKAAEYRGAVVREHIYTDEHGNPKHRSTKYEFGKNPWAQHHWDERTRQWFGGLGNVGRYLFRLPELLRAIERGEEIWLPEGEKDADRLWVAGVPATTNAMGASFWHDSYTQVLKGCRIVLVRDPDKAGYERVRKLYPILTGAGCFVRVVQAADTCKDEAGNWIIKDAYDHLEAGRSIDEFEPVLDPLEKWKEPKKEADPAFQLEIVDGGANPEGAPSADPPKGGGGASVTREEPPDWRPLTDIGNAERLIDEHGKDLRWCHKFGAWLMWDGVRWKEDETGGAHVAQMAVRVVRGLKEKAKKIQKVNVRQALLEHAKACEGSRKLEAMIKWAKTLPGVPITPDELDPHEHLLGVKNGVVDLRAGCWREARREDYITKQCGVAWDPDADCDEVEEWVLTALSEDLELMDFLFYFSGYTATGSVKEQAFGFLQGPGGSGKSTYTGLMERVLGDYVGNLRSESLMTKITNDIPTDIAKLKGCRMALVDETAQEKRFNESLLKTITGGGRITARKMREDEFSYYPNFTLWITGNVRPKFINFDKAIERRMKLIPFNNAIPNDKLDKGFAERLYKTQLPGFLRLLVRYASRWYADVDRVGTGLPKCAKVSDAVAQYQIESDSVGRFIEEYCEVGKDKKVEPKTIYEKFVRWCKTTGDYPISLILFGNELELKGYSRVKSNGVRYHSGLSLKDELVGAPIAAQGDPRYDE